MAFNEYESLEDYIMEKASVSCSVFVGPSFVSIRAASPHDYNLARLALKNKPGFNKEIRCDLFGDKKD